jgi:hypothetical protein
MAAIVSFVRKSIDGTTEAFATYAVYKADAADTMDLAADFVKVVTALWIPSTGSSAAGTMTPSGTTVTVPASASDDDGWMAVQGARVQTLTSP